MVRAEDKTDLRSIVTGPFKDGLINSTPWRSTTPPSPYDVIGLFIGALLAFVGVLFLVLTIMGGVQWMTAGGNAEKVSQAQLRIRNGVIGVIIIFTAYIITGAVLQQVCTITGANCGQ